MTDQAEDEAIIAAIKERFYYDPKDKCIRRRGFANRTALPVGGKSGSSAYGTMVKGRTISMQVVSWIWHTGQWPIRRPWSIDDNPLNLSPENLTVDDEMIGLIRRGRAMRRSDHAVNTKALLEMAERKHYRLTDVMLGFPIDKRPANARKPVARDMRYAANYGQLPATDGRLRSNLKPTDGRFRANKKAAPARDPDILLDLDDDPDILV